MAGCDFRKRLLGGSSAIGKYRSNEIEFASGLQPIKWRRINLAGFAPSILKDINFRRTNAEIDKKSKDTIEELAERRKPEDANVLLHKGSYLPTYRSGNSRFRCSTLGASLNMM